MGSLFSDTDRQSILRRLDRLTPTRRPRWGRFTAPEMICHVGCGLRNGLGELDAGPPRGPFARAPINWLAIHVLPWPHGVAQAPPAYLSTKPTTWEADVERLRDLIGRFSARGPEAEWPQSPVFGAISGRSWGALQYKHLDYHLRQFDA
ncbi:MAG TPA: hypothetical protein VEI06_17150 [Gemmatimonadaceae bacterium]|nr:hypothetical protein [Gemmatimonadaceae bacterium]